MLFDSHAHLNSDWYEKDGDLDILCGQIGKELSYVMDVGFDLESSLTAVKHAQMYDWCYAAVGIHPHDAKGADDNTIIMLKGLAKKPKVMAIGEMGLDYYHNHSPKDVQKIWFEKQIKLAIELDMPIIIHDRDAHKDTLDILGSYDLKKGSVLMHCYSGSAQMAQQCIKRGYYLSIAGPVTYNNASKLVEVVREIPLEYLLIETDCPYLTPEPHRGKRNTPLNVKYTADKMAEIKGMSFEEIAKTTCENAKRFYRITN